VTTFLLVHGAFHAGWCWHPLVEALRERGHRSVAPDLPCDDPQAGLAEYTDAALAALAAAGVADDDTDVVVVGHSLGGFTAPLVAQRRPVRGLVLLCTAPIVDASTGEELRARMVTPEYAATPRFTDEAGRQLFAPADARRIFYHDVPDALAERAVAHLRPQAPTPLLQPWGLDRWPDVARLVVLTRSDRAVRIDAAIEAAHTIVDGEPVLLDGSHSPFLSRPGELADVLDAWLRERAGSTPTG
jgi:pimeloyl-ACP methyl ester carboxylesterase